ncbi:hypothetical protein CEXT_134781 [Caerostris extrusa]|uniref:Uncharacterized protein n=1 Tax=Caerostris extrusa TaxID=172846 RepID=A0AAV4NH87_CAEEX|nr:hypothetical protein CEXT_134781 [Caerostris extrusa]
MIQTCVQTCVIPESGRLAEPPPEAHVALEGLLLCVRPHVRPQIAARVEPLVTDDALQLLLLFFHST